jgi:hypothetical protein
MKRKPTPFTNSKWLFKMKAQDLYPLPDGLFTHFQGCRPRDLDYKLDFKFNQNKPDQLVLTAI